PGHAGDAVGHRRLVGEREVAVRRRRQAEGLAVSVVPYARTEVDGVALVLVVTGHAVLLAVGERCRAAAGTGARAGAAGEWHARTGAARVRQAGAVGGGATAGGGLRQEAEAGGGIAVESRAAAGAETAAAGERSGSCRALAVPGRAIHIRGA